MGSSQFTEICNETIKHLEYRDQKHVANYQSSVISLQLPSSSNMKPVTNSYLYKKNKMAFEAKIIELPKILDDRGNLTFIEGENHIPFKIERTYWIYDVPGGEKRGGHAYKELSELIIALSGSFDIVLDNGVEKQTFSLNRSYYGLLVPKMIWRQMENFSTNSLGLILASDFYEEQDYIRDYEQFKTMVK